MTPRPEIPTIDLAGLAEPDRRARIGDAMAAAYAAHGFAYAVNHGIPKRVIDRAFEAHARFHAQTLEDKQRIAVNRFHRGYIALATSVDRASSIEAARMPNHSESFIKLFELAPDDPDLLAGRPLHGPNQWPEAVPEFRKAVLDYESAVERVARGLVRAMALALCGDPDALDRHFERPTTWLRLLHYPARPAAAPDGLYGSAPHTDFGVFTLLAQDAAGGLQVRGPDGAWLDVPPREGALVVNTGDVVPVWSGGRWRSTPHRVVNPSVRERHSIAYFFDPSPDTEVAPLVAGAADAPAPFRFEDHVLAQLDATYDYRDAAPGGP